MNFFTLTAMPAMVHFWSKAYWIEFFTNAKGMELYIPLFIISFTESCCFILPPDPFLPLLCADRTLAGLFAIWFVATAASVIGAAAGYGIGIKGGRPLAMRLFDPKKIDKAEQMYNKYDALAVFIAAFTPIPYKVFTILGGVCRINFWRFIAVSIFGRGTRYLIWSLLGWFFKDQAKYILHNIDKVMAIIIVALFALVLGMFIKKKISGKTAGSESA